MIYTCTLTVILFAFLCPYQSFGEETDLETNDQNPLAATCSAETVDEVFTAITFIDLISVHDPKIVFELSLPSYKAAAITYKAKFDFFTEKGFTNAKELATIAASAVLLVKDFTIALYYYITSNTFGEFLIEKGHLSCRNVTHIASTYVEDAEKEFKSLGSGAYESYMGAILLGTNDCLERLGYTEEENKDNWKLLIDIFYNEFSKFAASIYA